MTISTHAADRERGMTTAEYSIGTLGTVMIALVLYRLGLVDGDGGIGEIIRNILQKAWSITDVFSRLRFGPRMGLM